MKSSTTVYIAGEEIQIGQFVRLDAYGKMVRASDGNPQVGVLPVGAKAGDTLEIDYSTTPPTIRNLTGR